MWLSANKASGFTCIKVETKCFILHVARAIAMGNAFECSEVSTRYTLT